MTGMNPWSGLGGVPLNGMGMSPWSSGMTGNPWSNPWNTLMRRAKPVHVTRLLEPVRDTEQPLSCMHPYGIPNNGFPARYANPAGEYPTSALLNGRWYGNTGEILEVRGNQFLLRNRKSCNQRHDPDQK